ncbi:hypothetical protein [Cellulomonas sp. URHE0023]|uniref:hypothetical protein n=1 Tax=Cellulomonas sp. URHE0023 TaxID=1380354 RepID=UPI0005591336|nr:hypothetical protein [Cellulomonas sp. URHE0023]
MRLFDSRIPFLRPRSDREVVVPVGPSVPAAAVRLALGALGLSTLVVAFSGPGPGPHRLFAAALFALVVAVVLRPEVGLAGLVVAIAGVRVLVFDPPPLAVVVALVVLVHLTLWTAALAARTSWRASIEWAVIGRGLRDVAVVQVFALALAVVAVAVVSPLGTADLWRGVAAVSAMAATVLVLPRRATQS